MTFILAFLASLTPPASHTGRLTVWRLSGADADFAAVKVAADACRYKDVEEVYGEHLVPYLLITIPAQSSAEYDCLRKWMETNKQLGFDPPPAVRR